MPSQSKQKLEAASYFKKGREYQKANNHEKAFEYYQLSAEKGGVDAQFNLGSMYYSGNGVEQDYKAAKKYFRSAAARGDAAAQHMLGRMYAKGMGVPQCYQKAMTLYELGAAQGDSKSQSALALMYKEGRGVPKNYAKALKWNLLSAQQGDMVSQCNLGNMYKKGLGVAQDYKEAVRWYQLSVDQGADVACYQLGDMYENSAGGIFGVRKNRPKAALLYKMAVERGYQPAQARLDALRQQGIEPAMNLKPAKKKQPQLEETEQNSGGSKRKAKTPLEKGAKVRKINSDADTSPKESVSVLHSSMSSAFFNSSSKTSSDKLPSTTAVDGDDHQQLSKQPSFSTGEG